MKKIIVLLLGLMLLIAACSTQTIYPQQTKGQNTPARAESVAQAEVTTSLIDQVQADTEAKNVKTQDLVVPIVFKTGKIGDTVIFGAMLNQVTNMQPITYFAKVSFVEARDSNYNKIEIDKSTVNSWIQLLQSEDVSLSEKESVFIPIIIKIGNEIKPGIKSATGSYEFSIQIYKRNDASFTEPIDNLKKSVFLKVQ
jgi:PBP1b-binding outer membrane lipoprotein LpoB